MKIFSKTHTIAANADAADVPLKDNAGKTLPKTFVVQHPVGTVLDLPDDSANDLVSRGLATEYKEDEHKAVDGRVTVLTPQLQTEPPLPDGATRSTVVRQDETLNDTGPGTVKTGDAHVVLRDTADDAARIAESERITRENAAKAAAGVGGVPVGGTAAPAK